MSEVDDKQEIKLQCPNLNLRNSFKPVVGKEYCSMFIIIMADIMKEYYDLGGQERRTTIT